MNDQYVTFLSCALAVRAKLLLEYLLERYHAGYVSPDKAWLKMLHADYRCANLLTLCPVTGSFMLA
jgi:hypothetical protein